MIDYYEELSLSRELDTKRIQEELIRLESLWHKREVNSPEKANKMLGLIMDAQKVFASETSRRKYDSDLENSKKEPEAPDVLQSKSLEKWTNQARMFFGDGQYDLAKASIDRALTYVDSESDNGDLFQLAADIYLENNDMRLSLECINKAIITSPDWADYYITKARIYERMFLADQQYDKRLNSINECRSNLMHAVSKAKASGDAVTESTALGMLAFSLYFHFNPDVVLAEEYAKRAEALGECTNSKRVLGDIAEKKNSHIYNEAKKEEGYGNLQSLRKALGLYESLGDWKDASERAAVCRTRIGQLENEEARRQQEEQRQREEQARKAKAEAEESERRAQEELEVQKKKKERTRKLVKIMAPIASVAIVLVILINSVLIPNSNYHSALDLMNAGSYGEAITVFRSLDGFRDSDGKIHECYDAISQEKYDVAAKLMNEGKYEEAITAFDVLDDYGDSALQASSCKDAIMQLQYEAAVGLMEERKYEEAKEAFEKLDDYEDGISLVADAYYEMGRVYLYGLDGQEINCEAAYDNFENALEMGKKEANFYLGLLCDDYYNYPELDYGKAVIYYEAAGEENLHAQCALGFMYYNGTGMEQDIVKAQEMFEAVIAAGCADGFEGMGEIAYDSEDYDTAFENFNYVVEESEEQVFIAVAMRNISYMYYFGDYVERDDGKSMEWNKKAAELGDTVAMRNIGHSYYHGDEYVKRDYGKAMEWYEKAAELGDAWAMRNIGSMYYYGEYVKRDYGEAMEWYEKAAELGDARAMNNIGVMYENGKGVEQNLDKSQEWYDKAASAKNNQFVLLVWQTGQYEIIR